MADSDGEIDPGAFDRLVLQVFEEQEERSGVLTYPLSSQRQALDFIKLMNRKGFPFSVMCEAIDEKQERFRSWRLGNGNTHVGVVMMKRINKTIQEAMFSSEVDLDVDVDDLIEEDDDEEETEDIQSFLDEPDSDEPSSPSPTNTDADDAKDLSTESSRSSDGETTVEKEGSAGTISETVPTPPQDPPKTISDDIPKSSKLMEANIIDKKIENASNSGLQTLKTIQTDSLEEAENKKTKMAADQKLPKDVADSKTEKSQEVEKKAPIGSENCDMHAADKLHNNNVKSASPLKIDAVDGREKDTSAKSGIIDSAKQTTSQVHSVKLVEESTDQKESQSANVAVITDESLNKKATTAADLGSSSNESDTVVKLPSELQKSDAVKEAKTPPQNTGVDKPVPGVSGERTPLPCIDTVSASKATPTDAVLASSTVPAAAGLPDTSTPGNSSHGLSDLVGGTEKIKQQTGVGVGKSVSGTVMAGDSSDSATAEAKNAREKNSALNLSLSSESEPEKNSTTGETKFAESYNSENVTVCSTSGDVTPSSECLLQTTIGETSEENVENKDEQKLEPNSNDSNLVDGETPTDNEPVSPPPIEKVVLETTPKQRDLLSRLAFLKERAAQRKTEEDKEKPSKEDDQIDKDDVLSPSINRAKTDMSERQFNFEVERRLSTYSDKDKKNTEPPMTELQSSMLKSVTDGNTAKSVEPPGTPTRSPDDVQQPVFSGGEKHAEPAEPSKNCAPTSPSADDSEGRTTFVENKSLTTVETDSLVKMKSDDNVASTKVKVDEKISATTNSAEKKPVETTKESVAVVQPSKLPTTAAQEGLAGDEIPKQSTATVDDKAAVNSLEKKKATDKTKESSVAGGQLSEFQSKTGETRLPSNQVSDTSSHKSLEKQSSTEKQQTVGLHVDEKTKESSEARDGNKLSTCPPTKDSERSNEPVKTSAPSNSEPVSSSSTVSPALSETSKFESSAADASSVDMVAASLRDEAENYDSDFDAEVQTYDDRTEALAAVKRLKSSRKDESGYLYVFTDTPAGLEARKKRFKVGQSRFPNKRLRQAVAFNPDIRCVTSTFVTKRYDALQLARDKLQATKLAGTDDWFFCINDVITRVIDEVVSEFN